MQDNATATELYLSETDVGLSSDRVVSCYDLVKWELSFTQNRWVSFSKGVQEVTFLNSVPFELVSPAKTKSRIISQCYLLLSTVVEGNYSDSFPRTIYDAFGRTARSPLEDRPTLD